MPNGKIKKILKAPLAIYNQVSAAAKKSRATRLPVGSVNFGDLRRVTPINPYFGRHRGQGVDRYYIEKFLASHAADIKGRVLEVADDRYSKQFGGDKITRQDILYKTDGNDRATIVSDLSKAENIPDGSFDCVIITQTLQFIYDFRAAVKNLHRILKPGGVLLATFPGISQIVRYDMEKWGDYWRFTTLAAEKLFKEFFPSDRVEIENYGNVLSTLAMLHGLAAEELTKDELDQRNDEYQLIVAVRAQK